MDQDLTEAISEGLLERCEQLISAGVKVNNPDSCGWPPLCHALSRGNARIARFLLESGADVNSCNPYGISALMLAASLSDNSLLSPIYNLMTPESRRKHSDSALRLACLRGKYSAARWLLTNTSAKVNALSPITGVSALHLAVIGGHSRLVKLLLVFGADPQKQSSLGITSLDIAQKQNPPDRKLLHLLGHVRISTHKENEPIRRSIQPQFTVNNIFLDVGGNVVLRNSPNRPVFDDNLRAESEMRALLSPSMRSVFMDSPLARSTPKHDRSSLHLRRLLPTSIEAQGRTGKQKASGKNRDDQWSVEDDQENSYSASTNLVFDDSLQSPGVVTPRDENKSSFFKTFFLTPLKNSVRKDRKRGRSQMETPKQGKRFPMEDTPDEKRVRKLSESLINSISFDEQSKNSVDFNNAFVYSQSPIQFTSPTTNYRFGNQHWENFEFGQHSCKNQQEGGDILTYNQTCESKHLTSLLSPKYNGENRLYRRGKKKNFFEKLKRLKTLTKRKKRRSRSLDDSGGYINFDELKDDGTDFKQLLFNFGLEEFSSIFLEHELDFSTFITMKRTDLISMGIEDTKSQDRILEGVNIIKQIKL